jgi:hypothetical protein
MYRPCGKTDVWVCPLLTYQQEPSGPYGEAKNLWETVRTRLRAVFPCALVDERFCDVVSGYCLVV